MYNNPCERNNSPWEPQQEPTSCECNEDLASATIAPTRLQLRHCKYTRLRQDSREARHRPRAIPHNKHKTTSCPLNLSGGWCGSGWRQGWSTYCIGGVCIIMVLCWHWLVDLLLCCLIMLVLPSSYSQFARLFPLSLPFVVVMVMVVRVVLVTVHITTVRGHGGWGGSTILVVSTRGLCCCAWG